MKKNDLSERLFEFAKRTILFIRCLPEATEYKVIKYQLIKSCTSAGANYEEAQSGSSKADFIYKTEISLREMRESNYWLRLIKETILEETDSIKNNMGYLIDESEQLTKILGSIVVKMKNKV